MKIVILGGTGQTGQHLVNQALHQGHSVTAVVRNPGKMTVTHENLKVVEGSIFSEESLKAHFQGHDAVVSCLGFPTSFFSGVTGYTQSMQATLNAMRETKINRVVTMTSWYTAPGSSNTGPFFIRNVLIPMIQSVLTNMYEMESILKKSEDINWTVVRPPGLKNAPETDKEIVAHEGYFVPDANGLPTSQSVARGDVARFMLSLLGTSTWLKKAVAITTI
ncbi:uncharacterized protein At2g34460, chloroplastic-like [Clupea harengus]|uniref:Uncharacterized protein At2g34460, chloroplastic-like n=1 Tax=Clupea harengus TaxID=7950 RepID=A0A6P3VM16_CLUHA|nr:uncharacterized protein At2g34460, chloroplastic-like [Clupea harengus]